MSALRYACLVCGKWVCSACGWKRHGASVRHMSHTCTRCGCVTGEITPTMHTELQWWEHNYRDTGGAYADMVLPQGYPFGQRPEGGLQAPFGPRTAASGPVVYQGVPVPRQGPYQQLDLKSWKRGVDDAIKMLEAKIYRDGQEAGWHAARQEMEDRS